MDLRLSLLLALIAFSLSGCLFQQTTVPTPTTPAATPTIAATATPTSMPSPSPTARASPTPTPSPTAQLQKECTISVNPNDELGPFKAGVSARFLNVEPETAVIKCTKLDSGQQGEKKEGGLFFRTCDYPAVQARKLETASASGGGVGCETLVVVQVNPDFAKTWTFSPGDESFTMNKSISNTTTRNYTITNTGSLELNTFSCTSDKSFVTLTCPSKIKVGENAPFNATFSVSGQSDGQQSVVITVKEKDLERSISVSLTLIS